MVLTDGFLQGLLCRRLFCFFLAPTCSSADHVSVDAHFDLKDLVMVRSRLSNHRIGRKAVESSLAPLLDLCFVIVFTGAMSLTGDLRELLLEQPGHDSA